MVGVTFWGGVDLASIAIWAFWIFFAGLVIYIQRENMREGYPLLDEDGTDRKWSVWPMPAAKTFKLPHGLGDVKCPSPENEHAHAREGLSLAQSSLSTGSPFVPTGNPMLDGVGPASWAPRRDGPELDAHGAAKIKPMAQLSGFRVSGGRDPRGKPVVSGDGEVVGRVIDMMIDVPEQLVRYLVMDLNPEGQGNHRLIPVPMCRIQSDRVSVKALFADNFASIPATAQADQVSLLEEDKISAYYAGGTLYAHPDRLESQV
jgi:photosynthetic reaction center H subunit